MKMLMLLLKAKDATVAAYYSDDTISYSRNEEPASGKLQFKIKLQNQKIPTGNYNVQSIS